MDRRTDEITACAESARPARHHVVFLGGPGIVYEELPPPPALAAWIAVGWRMKASERFELRVLPDGCMDLIGGDVVGSLRDPLCAVFEPGDVAEGVRFHPGGFPALFGIPADELVGQRLPITDVAPTYRSLRRLASSAEAPDPICAALLAIGNVRLAAREIGYSERQLRRRILAGTGHPPKRLLRIARMQAVLRTGRGESWARTAAQHGFFDEAHMANDIRALAGATPHSLLG